MKPTAEQLEQLSAYLDGELAPPERASVERLLADNADLRRELAALRRTIDAVRGLPRERAPAGLADEVATRLARRQLLDEADESQPAIARTYVILRRLAVAAVFVLAVGVGWRYFVADDAGVRVQSDQTRPDRANEIMVARGGVQSNGAAWSHDSGVARSTRAGDPAPASPIAGRGLARKDAKRDLVAAQIAGAGQPSESLHEATAGPPATDAPLGQVIARNRVVEFESPAARGGAPTKTEQPAATITYDSSTPAPVGESGALIPAHGDAASLSYGGGNVDSPSPTSFPAGAGDVRLTLMATDADAMQAVADLLTTRMLQQQAIRLGRTPEPASQTDARSTPAREYGARPGFPAVAVTTEYPLELQLSELGEICNAMREAAPGIAIVLERPTDPGSAVAVQDCDALMRLTSETIAARTESSLGSPVRSSPTPAAAATQPAGAIEPIQVLFRIDQQQYAPVPATRSDADAP